MRSKRSVVFSSDVSRAYDGAAAVVGAILFASWLLQAAQFEATTQPLTFFAFVSGILEGVGAAIWNFFEIEVPAFLAVTTGTSIVVLGLLIKGYFSNAPTFYDYFIEVLDRFPQLSPVLKPSKINRETHSADDMQTVASSSGWVMTVINDGIQHIGDAAVLTLAIGVAIVTFLPNMISYWIFGWINREAISHAIMFWSLLIVIVLIATGVSFYLFSAPFMALENLTQSQRISAFSLAFVMSAAVWIYPRFLISSGILALGVFFVDKALFAADIMPVLVEN